MFSVESLDISAVELNKRMELTRQLVGLAQTEVCFARVALPQTFENRAIRRHRVLDAFQWPIDSGHST